MLIAGNVFKDVGQDFMTECINATGEITVRQDVFRVGVGSGMLSYVCHLPELC